MHIAITTLIWFVAFMVYFFFAVGTYRLYTKIHSPYDADGHWHWHTDDIKSWNFTWALLWPICLPLALIYSLFISNFFENISARVENAIDFFMIKIIGGFFENTYKFYNKVFDNIFKGKI